MTEPRKGCQTPTQSVILPYNETKGAEVIELYSKTGRTAQPWQELIVYEIGAEGVDFRIFRLEFAKYEDFFLYGKILPKIRLLPRLWQSTDYPAESSCSLVIKVINLRGNHNRRM
ncbi:MAG: hypothetical protein PUI91_02920 [Firmicutes bacterium]|nr:hypothetical protein [Bacillota bacterium]MDY2920020.1 hypothetical protein [Lentihominibacter sp.]